MTHDVPRAVATLLLPWVRKRPPLSRAHSERTGFFLAAARATFPPRRQERKLPPRSASVVMPWPGAPGVIWKRPPQKTPLCVRPAVERGDERDPPGGGVDDRADR